MKENLSMSSGSSEAIQQTTNLYTSARDERKIRSNPRGQAILDWLYRSKANEEWYDANSGNLKFCEDGIEILGDLFELEDETAETNGVDVWNLEGNTYFSFEAAQEHAVARGKRIPANWSKYIDFIPGDEDNKIAFLRDVLGLKLAGSQDLNDFSSDHLKEIPASLAKYIDFLPVDKDMKIEFLRDVLGLKLPSSQDSNEFSISNNGFLGFYWTSSPYGIYAYHLVFSAHSLHPNEYTLHQFGYTLRCIKTKH